MGGRPKADLKGVSLAGYLIANIEVKDTAKFDEYRQKVARR
jgi:uncharacterized protein (DUF1330 family)